MPCKNSLDNHYQDNRTFCIFSEQHIHAREKAWQYLNPWSVWHVCEVSTTFSIIDLAHPSLLSSTPVFTRTLTWQLHLHQSTASIICVCPGAWNDTPDSKLAWSYPGAPPQKCSNLETLRWLRWLGGSHAPKSRLDLSVFHNSWNQCRWWQILQCVFFFWRAHVHVD